MNDRVSVFHISDYSQIPDCIKDVNKLHDGKANILQVKTYQEKNVNSITVFITFATK